MHRVGKDEMEGKSTILAEIQEFIRPCRSIKISTLLGLDAPVPGSCSCCYPMRRVRERAVSRRSTPRFFIFFPGCAQEFFVSVDWQKRQTEKARPFVHKSAFTLRFYSSSFFATYTYLDLEYMTRDNGQRDAYSQVGLVEAIDVSRYRFRFLS